MSTIFMHSGDVFPIEKSNLFIEWQMEKQAIAEFRWLESEKMGYDIGEFRAEWMWWTTRQRSWRAAVRASGVTPV